MHPVTASRHDNVTSWRPDQGTSSWELRNAAAQRNGLRKAVLRERPLSSSASSCTAESEQPSPAQAECSLHGKYRSMQSMVADGSGGYKCGKGTECKQQPRSSGRSSQEKKGKRERSRRRSRTRRRRSRSKSGRRRSRSRRGSRARNSRGGREQGRSRGRSRRGSHSHKRAKTAKHEDVVSLANIRWTHDTIATQFGDGKTFAALISDLRRGKVHPMDEDSKNDFLILDVIKNEANSLVFSINNRRLGCLKKWADETDQHLRDVKVRVKYIGSFKNEEMMFKSAQSLTTTNGGKSIEQRQAKAYPSTGRRARKGAGKRAREKGGAKGRGKLGGSSARRGSSGSGARGSGQ